MRRFMGGGIVRCEGAGIASKWSLREGAVRDSSTGDGGISMRRVISALGGRSSSAPTQNDMRGDEPFLMCGGDFEGGFDAFGERATLLGEGSEIAPDLNAVPEGVCLAEEDAEADGHGRSDVAFVEDDLVDRAGRDADSAVHGVL